jgi:hypothetical protein
VFSDAINKDLTIITTETAVVSHYSSTCIDVDICKKKYVFYNMPLQATSFPGGIPCV